MNEEWALESIKNRELVWKEQVFDIVKVNQKYCDGCYFKDKNTCPHAVCNSVGGGILVLNKEKTKKLKHS